MTDLISIYVTFPSHTEALATAERLVQSRLIACANVFQPVTSVYEWKGQVESSQEVAAFFKTHSARVKLALADIRKHHSYSCPCIIALPIENSDPDYERWIRTQVDQPH